MHAPAPTGCTQYEYASQLTTAPSRYIITGTQSGRGFDIPSRGLAANALGIHLFIAFADFGNK